jgi:hypothetical protein
MSHCCLGVALPLLPLLPRFLLREEFEKIITFYLMSKNCGNFGNVGNDMGVLGTFRALID